MRQSLLAGLGFGLSSGVITTLGLIIGLTFSVGTKAAVLGGIITIAVADALSDALGMHISQESNQANDGAHIWESTLSTFISKLVIALTFAAPVLLLPLSEAVVVCIAWGMLLLSGFSYAIAKKNRENPLYAVSEHLLIGIIVLIATYFIGIFIKANFA